MGMACIYEGNVLANGQEPIRIGVYIHMFSVNFSDIIVV